MKTIGSEIKNEGSLELEKAILRFLAQTLRDSKVGGLQRITVKSQSKLAASFSGIVHWVEWTISLKEAAGLLWDFHRDALRYLNVLSQKT